MRRNTLARSSRPRPTSGPDGAEPARLLPLGLALAALLLAAAALRADWPHWRGPQRTGFSAERGLPLVWDRTTNVAWSTPLPGTSGATPIVWEERVFLNVAVGDRLELWGLDRADGSVLWKRPLGGGNVSKRKGNLSSPSPVTDGEMVWAMTGTGVLTAFDFAGNERWRRDLQAEYGQFGVLHGYSSSPLLHAGALYVQVLHGFLTDDPSYVLAIEGSTGATRWRIERPTDAPREAPDAYTTPALLSTAEGERIVISGADYVTAHDPATGREVWRLPGLNPSRNPMQRVVASPLIVGDLVIAPSRVRPLLALRAGGDSGELPAVVWSTDRGPDVPTPASDGERLYILTDGGVLWSLEVESGRVVWGPARVASATYSASPLLADGRLYVTSESGLTTVVAAGPEFEVLAENDVDEYTLASLAVSDGQIFLRTAEHLYCIGQRQP